MTNTDKFKEVLKGIADNIRTARGTTAKIPFNDLVEMSAGLEVAPTTYILVDEDGNQLAAIASDERVELTAKADTDIRAGTTAITNDGLVEGTKEIPAYQTTQGRRVIKAGEELVIPFYSDEYQYTKLQVIVCAYNTSVSDSVAARMVVINDKVYEAGENTPLATVTVNDAAQSINLGLINNGESSLVLMYMTIKEDS